MSAYPQPAPGTASLTPYKVLAALVAALAISVGVLLLGKLAVYLIIGLVLFVAFAYMPVLGLYATTVLLLLSGS